MKSFISEQNILTSYCDAGGTPAAEVVVAVDNAAGGRASAVSSTWKEGRKGGRAEGRKGGRAEGRQGRKDGRKERRKMPASSFFQFSTEGRKDAKKGGKE